MLRAAGAERPEPNGSERSAPESTKSPLASMQNATQELGFHNRAAVSVTVLAVIVPRLRVGCNRSVTAALSRGSCTAPPALGNALLPIAGAVPRAAGRERPR